MIIRDVEDTVVTVEVTRTIRTGGQYRISPSYGYAGIIEGVVTVLAIWDRHTIEEIAGDDDVQDGISAIEGYKEAALSMHTDRDDKPYEPEYSDELRRLDESVWVVYQYPHGDGVDYGILAFPLEEFIDHTSTLI
jgi:hypothetical protein